MQKCDRQCYPFVARSLLLLLVTAFCVGSVHRRAVAQPTGGKERAVTLDDLLRPLIAQHGLTGDPTSGRNWPTLDTPVAQLGRHLFFTKLLSSRGNAGWLRHALVTKLDGWHL